MGPNRIYICNSFDNTRWKGCFINCLFVDYIIYVFNSLYFPTFNHWHGNRKSSLCLFWQEPVYLFVYLCVTVFAYWSWLLKWQVI